MPLFVASNIIAIFILVVLAFLGSVSLFARYHQRSYQAKKGFTMFKISSDKIGESLPEFLKTLPPPFAFEIVVHYLGKGTHYYITVPNIDAKRIRRMLDAEEIQDFDVHYSGGIQKGAYLKDGEGWPLLNLRSIDFSKVNEIGEGVVMQFVCRKKGGQQRAVNIRILVTAPSEFQAAEIMNSVKEAFPGFRVVEIKNAEFLQRVYFREFETKELALIF